MKKINIVLTIILILLAGVYLACCIIIPEQTNVFLEHLSVVLNYPITIAGVSVTLGGLFLWIITNFVLKNTKFGRRELNNMRKEVNYTEQQFNELKANTLEQLCNFKNDIDDFKKDTETKTTVMINQFENLQNNMLTALKAIPNKKVQDIIQEYEANYEVKKQEFMEKAINSDKYIEEKLTNMFKDFMLEVEEKLNEREETVDTKTEAA